jgi:hypothetical protein
LAPVPLPLPAPWTWISPKGAPHVVHSEDDLSDFNAHHIKAQLNNVRHHLGFFTGNGESHQVNGWIVWPKLQWLKRQGRKEYVPVLGGVERFSDTIHAQRYSVDMPFKRKKLLEHLAHARKHGPQLYGALSDFKWQVVAAPLDPWEWLAQAHQPRLQPEAAAPEQPVLPVHGARPSSALPTQSVSGAASGSGTQQMSVGGLLRSQRAVSASVLASCAEFPHTAPPLHVTVRPSHAF